MGSEFDKDKLNDVLKLILPEYWLQDTCSGETPFTAIIRLCFVQIDFGAGRSDFKYYLPRLLTASR